MHTEIAWATWVTITGANGTTATGQAVLDYAQTYPYQYNSLRSRSDLLSGATTGYAAPAPPWARFQL